MIAFCGETTAAVDTREANMPQRWREWSAQLVFDPRFSGMARPPRHPTRPGGISVVTSQAFGGSAHIVTDGADLTALSNVGPGISVGIAYIPETSIANMRILLSLEAMRADIWRSTSLSSYDDTNEATK